MKVPTKSREIEEYGDEGIRKLRVNRINLYLSLSLAMEMQEEDNNGTEHYYIHHS